MQISRKASYRWFATALLLTLSGHALSDWQADRKAWLDDWRTGKVIKIEPLAAGSPAPNDVCLIGGDNTANHPTTSYQRVILRYTQTRRSHQYQFIMPVNAAFQPGSMVRFNVQSCTQPQLIAQIS